MYNVTVQVGLIIAKWLFLATVNICLIVILFRYRDQAAKLTKTQSNTAAKDFRSSNLILISSILLYFVCYAPTVIIKILDIASRPPFCTYNLRPDVAFNAEPIVTLILLCNYSLNCVIYVLVSRRFQARIIKWWKRIIGKNDFNEREKTEEIQIPVMSRAETIRNFIPFLRRSTVQEVR